MKVNSQESPKEPNETPSDISLASPVNASNETDTTCWTIKLPPKLSLNTDTNNQVQNETSLDDTSVKKVAAAEPSVPDTPPSVTMTISSTTPAEFARRRRIKRRSTGIEDSESGLILSPETVPDSTNPFTSQEIVDAAFHVILSVCIH